MQSQNEVITKRQTMIYYRRTDSTMTMKNDREWSTIEEQTVQWQNEKGQTMISYRRTDSTKTKRKRTDNALAKQTKGKTIIYQILNK